MTQSLAALEVSPDACNTLACNTLICFGDEMRLGLHSPLRRRWCLRGHPLVQPQQMRFEWKWLSLAVDVQTGRLFWHWQERLRSDCVQETLLAWQAQGIDVLVWDNAPSHRAKVVTEAAVGVGLSLAYLPPFSPELNPAERVFEEVRRWVEGKVYSTLADKVEAVESYLRQLSQDIEAVKRLAGWQWIRQSLQSLSEGYPSLQDWQEQQEGQQARQKQTA